MRKWLLFIVAVIILLLINEVRVGREYEARAKARAIEAKKDSGSHQIPQNSN